MDNRQEMERLKARIAKLEQDRRYIQNALSMALAFGEYRLQVNSRFDPSRVLQEASKRIRHLIALQTRAFFDIDPNSNDIRLVVCNPASAEPRVQSELDFLIEQGFVAWALNERRGIIVGSSDRRSQILLHSIATPARKRGLFMGLLQPALDRVPDFSMDLLSIILRNAANAIESAELYRLLRDQNLKLRNKVVEGTKTLDRYEKQLKRAQKIEAMGTLAGGVAHDLNNILSGLVSYPELLLREITRDSHLYKPLRTIQRSGEKAAAIVQDLLTLARRGVSVAEVVSLNRVVEDYLKSPEYQKTTSFHPQISIQLDLNTNLLNIVGSPIHLSKTLMNLVSNAVEAMPEGGRVTISTTNQYIDTPLQGYDNIEEGDYVVVTVADTGIGIPPNDLDHIFEPFYTKKVMGRSGTGLGMAVVWGTVKDHKGYIDVNSREGQGTVIKLYFPATRQRLRDDPTVCDIEACRGRGESVLVIDDVEEQREIASEMLTTLGYRVETVSSGEAAIEYLKAHPIDLLVLDMIMDPGLDGLETYKIILAFKPGQKAIIASGFSETARVKAALELGAGTYIKKPYLINVISAAVRAELDR
jgi:signal transduction histidine kinase